MTPVILFATFLWMAASAGAFVTAMAGFCLLGGGDWRDTMAALGCFVVMGAAAVSVLYSLAAFTHAAHGI